MSKNAEKFQQMLAQSEELRERIQGAAASYDGSKNDDRAAYEAIVVPVARSVGIELSYDEALEVVLDGYELTEDELEMIAGGAGVLYHRLVSGAIAATLILGSVPMRAFAQDSSSGSTTTGAQVEQIVDQAALDAISYAPNFSAADIAVPEGVAATPNGIEATSAEGQEMLALSTDNDKRWSKAGDYLNYTVEALGYVDKDAQKVAEFGKVIFSAIKGGVTGNYGNVIYNGAKLLRLLGIVGGTDEPQEKDISNKELQQDIKQLNDMVSGMSAKLDEVLQKEDRNRLTTFDNAVSVLAMDCTRAEAMFKRADELAKSRGLDASSENKDPGELVLPPMPELPPMPTTPNEPEKPQLPAEPSAPVLPAEPVQPEPLWEGASAEDAYLHGMMVKKWEQEHSSWQAECDRLNTEYEQAKVNWQAECDRLNAEYEQKLTEYQNFNLDDATQKWKEECERITKPWGEECDRLRKEHETKVAAHDKDYTATLIDLMREEERTGKDANFTNFTALMDRIDTNFSLVAAECAKSAAFNPISAFDSYWDLYFNWRTQGYYLRSAYRTNIQYQLKRSYALLALRYGLTSQQGGGDSNVHAGLTDSMAAALNGIDAIPAGQSPADVAATRPNGDRIKEINIYCNTLKQNVRLISATSRPGGIKASDQQIKDYASRLHGRTVQQDLELAGITAKVLSPTEHYYAVNYNTDECLGISFGSRRTEKDRLDTCYSKVLMWNGTIKEIKTLDGLARSPRTRNEQLHLVWEGRMKGVLDLVG